MEYDLAAYYRAGRLGQTLACTTSGARYSLAQTSPSLSSGDAAGHLRGRARGDAVGLAASRVTP